MAYSSLQVANEFLKLAQKDATAVKDISNMKLQKLVFFAQLLSVCMNIDQPLCDSHFHAWDYGPVCPILYRKIKQFKSNFIELNNEDVRNVFKDCEPIEESWALEIIKAIWGRFKQFTSVGLSALSHRKNSPWSIVYNTDRYGIISNETMAKYKFGEISNG